MSKEHDMQLETKRARLVRDTMDALNVIASKPPTRNTLGAMIGLKHYAQQIAEEEQLHSEVPPTLPAFSPEQLKAARDFAVSVMHDPNLG